MKKHVSLTIRRPSYFSGRLTNANTLAELLHSFDDRSVMRSAIKWFVYDIGVRERISRRVHNLECESLGEFSHYLAVPPIEKRRHLRTERVTILIPGQRPRAVKAEYREPLADVLMRICSRDFALDRATKWYCCETPDAPNIQNIYDFRVEDGMKLAGLPKINC